MCVSDQLGFVHFLDVSNKQSYKVQREHDTYQTREGVAQEDCHSSASSWGHVVYWSSHVHFVHRCVSLFVHNLQFLARLSHLHQLLHF